MRLSVEIAASLRHALEEARERSGRSLTAEVTARLRSSLRSKGDARLLLLRLDEGLAAHMKALTAAHFVGDLEETAIYMLRSQLIEYLSNKYWRAAVREHLPSPYREAFSETLPVYRTLATPESGKG